MLKNVYVTLEIMPRFCTVFILKNVFGKRKNDEVIFFNNTETEFNRLPIKAHMIRIRDHHKLLFSIDQLKQLLIINM